MVHTLRTLVVDDSIIFRKVVRDCLKLHPRCEVIDVARDGASAIEKIRLLKPDLVTLDFEMPNGSGLDVLEAIKNDAHRPRTLLLSAHAGVGSRGADMIGRAISLGADDYLLKPDGESGEENFNSLGRQLTEKINAITKMRTTASPLARRDSTSTSSPTTSSTSATSRTTVTADAPVSTPVSPMPIDALCIGISTGGPAALTDVMPQFKQSFPVPILIVQHMPAGFTKGLADHLDKNCQLKVQEAVDGMPVTKGNVYIAPGGRHMAVTKQGIAAKIVISDEAPIRSCRPCVDRLFESAAAAYRNHLLAVVMTGMGSDGVEGAKVIKQSGGHVWTQNADSCVVYGMPRAVKAADLSDRSFAQQDLVSDLNHATSRNAIAKTQAVGTTAVGLSAIQNNSVAQPLSMETIR